MKLKVKFSESDLKLGVQFAEEDQIFKAKCGEVQHITEYIGGEKYTGDYSITPKVEEQRIQTKDKVLLDDVTVHAIPFFEVSNTSGGNTVYIADEIYFE